MGLRANNTHQNVSRPDHKLKVQLNGRESKRCIFKFENDEVWAQDLLKPGVLIPCQKTTSPKNLSYWIVGIILKLLEARCNVLCNAEKHTVISLIPKTLRGVLTLLRSIVEIQHELEWIGLWNGRNSHMKIGP